MNIVDILQCPKCRVPLSTALRCPVCERQYYFSRGVYDVVCWDYDLSGDSKPNWQFNDKAIDLVGIPEPKKQESAPHGDGKKDWRVDYYERINEETKRGQKLQADFMNAQTATLSGVVCDLATGLGGNLRRLIEHGSRDIQIVAMDLDKTILMHTRNTLIRGGVYTTAATAADRVSYVASDGRYLSFADECFDAITSAAGFGNVPDMDKTARELYRVLKPGGRLLIEGSFIEKDSRSYELAKGVGIEKGMVEEFMTESLAAAGFGRIDVNVVAEAVWAENPYDLVPAAGDTQRFNVIQAIK